MRSSSIFIVLVSIWISAINLAFAQQGTSLQPKFTPLKGRMDATKSTRPKPVPGKSKPLTGKVDYHGVGAALNAFEGKLDRFRGLGRADGRGLEGTAEHGSLRGGAESAPLTGGVGRADPGRPFQLDSARTRLPGDVSDKELALLGQYDVIVMQDRSSSMAEEERFPNRFGRGSREMSRWQWCLEQTLDLTRQTARLPGKGVTLVLFSSKYDVYENVALHQVPHIFSRHRPFIGTKLAPPLEDMLDRYFRARDAGLAKPLIIAVITDAIPQDEEKLRKLIISTTYQMHDPREISITFLQVGTEEGGRELLRKLDRKLIKKGALYDIVGARSFGELLEVGLTRALINTIESQSALQLEAGSPSSLPGPRINIR